MEKIIIPDDGIIYKTKNGKPVLELLVDESGNMFKLYDYNSNVKIALATQENSQAVFIGDSNSC